MSQAIGTSLQNWDLQLAYVVDFREKCDYAFVSLEPVESGYQLGLRDCRDRNLGQKAFSTHISSMAPGDLGTILAFNIQEMLFQEPTDMQEPDLATSSGGSSHLQFPALANEHHSRYYFSPSAFNLRKNEFYDNTLNFVIHDIQYGFSKNFSLGLGSTVAFIPIYLTPKFSFQLAEKHHLAIGDLLGYGSWGVNDYFNLAYVAYTYGSLRDNLTIGLGYVNTDFEPGFNNKPILSLAATTDFGPRLFFVTEHYFIPWTREMRGSKMDTLFVDEWGYPTGNYDYITYDALSFSALGFLGVRFVSRKRNTVAFQFGVGYLTTFYKNVLSELRTGEFAPYEFYVDENSFDAKFYMIPTMNFTYKFGGPIE